MPQFVEMLRHAGPWKDQLPGNSKIAYIMLMLNYTIQASGKK
jgi:hypothetical protein